MAAMTALRMAYTKAVSSVAQTAVGSADWKAVSKAVSLVGQLAAYSDGH